MKKLILCVILLLTVSGAGAQVLGVKTNVLAWGAYGTTNLGLEAGFAPRWSVVLDGAYNPFSWGNGKKTNLVAFQSELRYWTRYKFVGHFVGVHGHWGEYDWGMKIYRYKGNLYGGGISYGYSYMISPRWCLEGNIGLGYTRLEHEYRYDRLDSRSYYPPNPENKWGLSRLGISLTYLIK